MSGADTAAAAAIRDRLAMAGATLIALSPSDRKALAAIRPALAPLLHALPSARGPDPDTATLREALRVLPWLGLLDGRDRRIVMARMLIHPVTGRAVFSWRRLGALLGVDHGQVQRWHAGALDRLAGMVTGAPGMGAPGMSVAA